MPLIWASGCPCQNELTWSTGAHRRPRAGWRRTAWTSPGSPLTTVTPPRTTIERRFEPYPDNWRASVRRPATLPHFPMVLHRGGYPDGS